MHYQCFAITSARLEKLQYRAAKLVTGALHFSSKEKLNSELGWESIQCRANMLGLNIFHKIHLKETRPLIYKCMPKLVWERRKPQRSRVVTCPLIIKITNLINHFFLTQQNCGIHLVPMYRIKI